MNYVLSLCETFIIIASHCLPPPASNFGPGKPVTPKGWYKKGYLDPFFPKFTMMYIISNLLSCEVPGKIRRAWVRLINLIPDQIPYD